MNRQTATEAVIKFPLAIFNNPCSSESSERKWESMIDNFKKEVTDNGFILSNKLLHLSPPTQESIANAVEVLGNDIDDFLIVRFGNPTERRRAIIKLTKKHLPLVLSISGFDQNIQEIGKLGLVYAIENFEIERGIRFSTYARKWIMSQIQRYRDSVLGYPSFIINEAKRMTRWEGSFYTKTGISPTEEDLLLWAQENNISNPDLVLACKNNQMKLEKNTKVRRWGDGKEMEELWGELAHFNSAGDPNILSADSGKIRATLSSQEWDVLSRCCGFYEAAQSIDCIAESTGRNKTEICNIIADSLKRVGRHLVEYQEINFVRSKEELMSAPLIAQSVTLEKHHQRIAILRSTVGHLGQLTLQEYGDILGLSRERIRQIEVSVCCAIIIEHEIEVIPEFNITLEIRKRVLDYFGLNYHEFKVGNQRHKSKISR